MKGKVVRHRSLGNFILDSLPQEDYELLETHLEQVILAQGDVLCQIREPITQVYFPTTALLSWLNSTSEGETVEVAMIGFEGIISDALLLNQDILPGRVKVQLTGGSFRIGARVFMNALHQSNVLQQKVNAFTYLQITQLTQYALCSRFHEVAQRLCRWLLAAQDRVKTHELLLTRDILAETIGSTRPAVSIVTGTLQSAGLIRTMRGKVSIVNREEMEEATCECYHVLKQAFDLYLRSEERIEPSSRGQK